MADIEDVVQGHTVQMAMMSGKLDNITESITDMKTILKEISVTQQNMAILMERVENHEENTKKSTDDVRESFKAVHARITRNEDDIKVLKKDHLDACDIVKPMAKKGEVAHGLMVKIAVALAIGAFGVVGTIIVWAIEQGATK